MEGFGTRLQMIRTQHGLTRRELAKRAGLHEMHLAKIEREERQRIEIDTLVKLAQALSVTTDMLCGLQELSTPGGRRAEKSA